MERANFVRKIGTVMLGVSIAAGTPSFESSDLEAQELMRGRSSLLAKTYESKLRQSFVRQQKIWEAPRLQEPPRLPANRLRIRQEETWKRQIEEFNRKPSGGDLDFRVWRKGANTENSAKLSLPEATSEVPKREKRAGVTLPEDTSQWDKEDIKVFIQEVFGEDWKTAWAIAMGESKLDREAENRKYPDFSIGLFQINLRAHADKVPGKRIEDKIEWLKDPENNIRMAYLVKEEREKLGGNGFNAWTVYDRGIYKKYLPR